MNLADDLDIAEAKTRRQLQRGALREHRKSVRQRRRDALANDPVFTEPLIPGGLYAPTEAEKREIRERINGRQRWYGVV